jgi:OmpA-OmpF porin, OOP family
MPAFTIRFTVIMLTLSLAAVAEAQMGDWYVAPSIVFTNDDSDRNIDDSLSGAQISVGRNMTQHISLEGLLGYSAIDGYCEPGNCWPDQKHLDISANLLAYFNRDSVFAPYLLVGVGYLGADANEGPQFAGNTGTNNNPSGSVGLGFKWRMGQSNYSIRGEHRVRAALDHDTFTDQLTTIGFQYDFGRSKTGIAGDGVLDIWDACPNTKPGVEVTSQGCKLKNLDRDDDEDEDHVNNNNDQCPNTPIGVAVDQVGCSLDSDMDGVPTSKDRCPASRAGADVNEFGCENDEDSDGVVDHRDDCLGTRAGARTDVKGCEIKDIISLPGVNFETSRDTLLPGTEYLLKTAADTLNKHPDLQIEVAGHSDDVGSADQNIGLSMRRAKTVRNFLIRYGVDESRLTFKGYREAQPIADNATAAGRATNRRVELRLVTL